MCYLILMTLLIDGDDKFGDVCDELVALGFPQSVDTNLEVLHQDFLRDRGVSKPTVLMTDFTDKKCVFL